MFYQQNLLSLLDPPRIANTSSLVQQCKHLAVALRKRILERKLTQTRLPFVKDEQQPAVQITVASFVHEMFRAAFTHLRELVDQRDQSEINRIFGLMHELIFILQTDPEQGLGIEPKVYLRGLMTEFGYLVQYFRCAIFLRIFSLLFRSLTYLY